MRLQGKLCECAIGVADTVIHNNYVTLTSIFKKIEIPQLIKLQNNIKREWNHSFHDLFWSW